MTCSPLLVMQPQPVGGDDLGKARSPDQRHGMAAQGQFPAHQTADRARADDQDSHRSRLAVQVIQAVGRGQDFDGVAAGDVRAMLQLPAARFGVAGGEAQLVALLAHKLEQLLAHVHRNLILLGLVAIGPGDAAAAGVALAHIQAGDEAENLQRGFADAMGALLTRRVIGQRERQRQEVGA